MWNLRYDQMQRVFAQCYCTFRFDGTNVFAFFQSTISHAFHLKRNKQTNDWFLFPLFIFFGKKQFLGDFELPISYWHGFKVSNANIERKDTKNKYEARNRNEWTNQTRFYRWIYDHCWSANKKYPVLIHVTIQLLAHNLRAFGW